MLYLKLFTNGLIAACDGMYDIAVTRSYYRGVPQCHIRSY